MIYNYRKYHVLQACSLKELKPFLTIEVYTLLNNQLERPISNVPRYSSVLTFADLERIIDTQMNYTCIRYDEIP